MNKCLKELQSKVETPKDFSREKADSVIQKQEPIPEDKPTLYVAPKSVPPQPSPNINVINISSDEEDTISNLQLIARRMRKKTWNWLV